MRRLIIRVRLWFLDKDINCAEDIQNRLRIDLPLMHNQRRDLLLELWALEQDQPV